MYRSVPIHVNSLLGLCLAISAVVHPSLAANNPTPQETIEVVDHEKAAEVKGVYMYSVSTFVTWPDSKRTEFRIGVIENELLLKQLTKIASRRNLHDKPIKVVGYSITDEVVKDECDIVYFASSLTSSAVSKMISSFGDRPILIFTDRSPAPSNSIVNFVIENSGIVFELDNKEAQKRKLAMDAKLLRQGRVMQSSSQP